MWSPCTAPGSGTSHAGKRDGVAEMAGRTTWKGNTWQGSHSPRSREELQAVLWPAVHTVRHNQPKRAQQRGETSDPSDMEHGHGWFDLQSTCKPPSTQSLKYRPQHFLIKAAASFLLISKPGSFPRLVAAGDPPRTAQAT